MSGSGMMRYAHAHRTPAHLIVARPLFHALNRNKCEMSKIKNPISNEQPRKWPEFSGHLWRKTAWKLIDETQNSANYMLDIHSNEYIIPWLPSLPPFVSISRPHTLSFSLIIVFLWFYARSIRQPFYHRSTLFNLHKALIHSFTHARTDTHSTPCHFTTHLSMLCIPYISLSYMYRDGRVYHFTFCLPHLICVNIIWFGNCLNIERLINQHCLFDVVAMAAYK